MNALLNPPVYFSLTHCAASTTRIEGFEPIVTRAILQPAFTQRPLLMHLRRHQRDSKPAKCVNEKHRPHTHTSMQQTLDGPPCPNDPRAPHEPPLID